MFFLMLVAEGFQSLGEGVVGVPVLSTGIAYHLVPNMSLEV